MVTGVGLGMSLIDVAAIGLVGVASGVGLAVDTAGAIGLGAGVTGPQAEMMMVTKKIRGRMFRMNVLLKAEENYSAENPSAVEKRIALLSIGDENKVSFSNVAIALHPMLE